jgi:hypothetical protein
VISRYGIGFVGFSCYLIVMSFTGVTHGKAQHIPPNFQSPGTIGGRLSDVYSGTQEFEVQMQQSPSTIDGRSPKKRRLDEEEG